MVAHRALSSLPPWDWHPQGGAGSAAPGVERALREYSGAELARLVAEDVDDPPGGIAEHEAPNAPVLVAQRVHDLVAELDRACVNRVDVAHLDRDERVAAGFGVGF